MDLIGIAAQAVMFTSVSWLRLFVALGLSALFSMAVGILMGRDERVASVLMPIVDVLQSLPILAFFPVAVYLIVTSVPSELGINMAVVFLLITSMVWNMIFGVYEAINKLPKEMLEVAGLYRLGLSQRISKIYLPASLPKLVRQSSLSWSIALFYLITSEIFSTGSSVYSVRYGIGVFLEYLATSGNLEGYVAAFLVFLSFVYLTRVFIFRRLEEYVNRYVEQQSSNIVLVGKHVFRHRRKSPLAAKLANVATEMHRAIKAVPSLISFCASGARRAANGIVTSLGEIANGYYVYALIATAACILAYVFLPGYLSYFVSGEYAILSAMGITFVRIFAAFVLILLVAIPISVYTIFYSGKSERYLSVFQVLSAIPATLILPLIAVYTPPSPIKSELVAFLTFFLSGIWYVLFSISSMQQEQMKSNIIEIKEVFGVNGFAAFSKLYLGYLAPSIITGGITAVAAEWNASIVAEYFTEQGISGTNVLSAVGNGLGKLLDTSLASGNLYLMVLALANLTLLIIVLNTFFWKRLYKRVARVYA